MVRISLFIERPFPVAMYFNFFRIVFSIRRGKGGSGDGMVLLPLLEFALTIPRETEPGFKMNSL